MAAPGVVSDCIARVDLLLAASERGEDVAGALGTLAHDIRDQARRTGDLTAIISGIELVASLSTPPGEAQTPAERFYIQVADLLRQTG